MIKDNFVVRERHSPEFNVCLTLSLLAGNHFPRVGGIVGGGSQSTQYKILMKVVRAVNVAMKDQFLHLQWEEKLQQNAEENLWKYKLPGFQWAVDTKITGVLKLNHKIMTNWTLKSESSTCRGLFGGILASFWNKLI